ncbi:MAG: 1-aminocyclopropane-1-carboxylate deaminase/D-cysteine desulfhydrase [Saprospiraceae bacterium]
MPFNVPISPLQIIAEHPGKERGITLFIKRDDLLHREICGSKWRKLAAFLPIVKMAHPSGIVTFGGPFSNHLQAVAAAGRIFGIHTFGIVRGQHADLQNPTLRAAQADGMMLFPIDKAEYDACKDRGDELLGRDLPRYYILPEGGQTPKSVEACAAIPWEISTQLIQQTPKIGQKPLYLCAPAGTGCTAAGIVAGLVAPNSRALVFPVSSHDFDKDTLLRMVAKTDLRDAPHWTEMERRLSIVHDYTFGGFAKLHPPVMDFARSFFQQTNILLDPIYTAKMFFGVFDMLAKGDFAPGSTVVALHTGGLQGWEGFGLRYGAAGTV